MSGREKQIREGKPEARFADPGPIPRPPDASSVAAMGNAYCKANARGPENADSRTPYKAEKLPKRFRSPGLSKGGPDFKEEDFKYSAEVPQNASFERALP